MPTAATASALEADAVDAWVLECLVTDAGRALADGRAPQALVLAEAAAGLLDGAGDAAGEGALARLRRIAQRHAATVRRVTGAGPEPDRPGRRGPRRAP